MADKAIEVLLDEKRGIFRRQRNSKNRPISRTQAFSIARAKSPSLLGQGRQRAALVQAVEKSARWNSPWAKWFVGGKINVSYNCLDRHVEFRPQKQSGDHLGGRAGRRAGADLSDVYREVSKFANVLKKLGVKKGDRVSLYMGMVPELAIAMLACARIGATHSVVFGGFSAEALRDRINDAQAKVLITADGGYRARQHRAAQEKRRRRAHRHAVDRTCRGRTAAAPASDVHMKEGRDHWWHELMADAPLVVRARAAR